MNVVGLIRGLLDARGDRITAEEAVKHIAEGALLVDVRSPLEFARQHIEGAINVPLRSVPEAIPQKATAIVLYCATGRRSRMAQRLIGDSIPCYDLGPMSAWSVQR